MKLGAIVIVNCDKDNIWYCLKGIYDVCDRIMIVYSSCDWNGAPRDDGTLAVIEDFEDPDKKIQIIVGEYTSQPGQRTAGLNILKEEEYDYCFVVDSDEIYHPEQLQWAREVIEDNPDIDIFSVQMKNLWKTLDYILLPDDRQLSCFYKITDGFGFTKSRGTTYKTKAAKTQEMIIAERELHFIGKTLNRRIKELENRGKSTKGRRRTIKRAQKDIEKQRKILERIEKQDIERAEQIQALLLDPGRIVCYHLTAVCDNQQMLRKIKTRSYKDSICPDWYHRKWLNWTYDMCNLHPTKPEQYEKAVPFDKLVLPGFMKMHRFWE